MEQSLTDHSCQCMTHEAAFLRALVEPGKVRASSEPPCSPKVGCSLTKSGGQVEVLENLQVPC